MESVRLTQGVVARQQPPKRVAIATLGCKVNSYESSAIARSFENANWSVVNLTESADVYVVNSCSVTAEADRQSRQQARRLSRANPHAKVIMTGCYAELQPAECADVTGVDLVTGNAGKFDIPRVAAALIQEGEPIPQLPDVPDRAEILPDVLHGYEKRARMNIQVQQGCDQGCTFCVIHTARGKSRSFAASTIEAQVQRAVEAGYREVVICGIDLGAYGNDFDSLNDENHLVKLLEKLSLMEGIFRIRLSSIDPAHLSDPLIELLSRDARFCPYFHLSVPVSYTHLTLTTILLV